MIRRATYVLSIIMTLICFTEAFASGASDLQWGMSKASVVAIMGEGKSNLDQVVSAENETLSYYGQTISKFDGAVLSLFFINDQLYSKQFSLKESAGRLKYNYLLNALKDKYGNEGNNIILLQKYLSSLSGSEVDETTANLLVKLKQVKIATWTSKDTDILLSWVAGKNKNDYGMTMIVYSPAGELLPEVDYKNDDL